MLDFRRKDFTMHFVRQKQVDQVGLGCGLGNGDWLEAIGDRALESGTTALADNDLAARIAQVCRRRTAKSSGPKRCG